MTVAERMLTRLREHPDAPRWNHAATDRLDGEDLAAVDAFRRELAEGRGPRGSEPSPAVLARVARWCVTVPRLRALRADAEAFDRIPTMSREDLATAPEALMPDDVSLTRLIVYRTAGVTGHALLVPHDARAVACYLPLLEVALRAHGVRFAPDGETVGGFLVGAQARTVTLPAVLQAWGGCGWAKLNLRPSEWRTSPHGYFRDLAPRLLTGDPISFAETLRMGIPATPLAMVSTAVAMSEALRGKLAGAYGCPVVDWYSLTETGPLAYRCPVAEAWHLLPHDVHVEVLAPPGERGEITVTGGRNPFLPLVRYRTGDFGRLVHDPCACGDPTPRLVELEGRAPVLFRAADGSVVNPVDLSRALRELPLVQHTLHQHADRSCTLTVRPIGALDPSAARGALTPLLGDLPLEVRIDPALGDRAGKVLPYVSDLLLED